MSQITKSEADRLDLFPPKIENVDKKTPLEVLVELFSKGYTTVPLDKLDELYTSSLFQKEKGKEEPSVVSNESELVNFIPNKGLAAELRQENQKKDNIPIY